ncbi:MAG: uroporphyrinogen-III synthase [Acidaminococcaceae bacterium]
MSEKVYLVCEKNVCGHINRQKLAKALQERNIEYELLPVSQRIAIKEPAISEEFFSKIAWLCFAMPDSVGTFYSSFHNLLAKGFSFKVAAQDVNTAAALSQKGLETDYVPVRPLAFGQKDILHKSGGIVVAVDGQEWAGLKPTMNIVCTKRKALSVSMPEERAAVFLLNTPLEAEYLFQAIPADGVFICKNPATAEICWQHGKTEVILPADFTYEGILQELKKHLFC